MVKVLPNQSWVCSPAHSKANWVVMKESAVFIAGHQARNPGQLVLKTPKLPDGFQESIFKGQVREGESQGM